jgi:GT2 family glycosyltransferase/glycosyltransferase involved in cell wall biosynthesis
MKIAVCAPALQLDGTGTGTLLYAEAITALGHHATVLASSPHRMAPAALPHGVSFIPIGQRRFESRVAHIQRMRRIFEQQKFDVVFLATGMPIPNLQPVLPYLPDDTALVRILLSDREHVYEPAVQTAPFWNAALAISPRLQQALSASLPHKPVQMITHGIHLPDAADVESRAPHASPLRLLYVGRLFGRKSVLLLPHILQACVARGIDVTLSVCGFVPDRQPLEDAFRTSGTNHLVQFLNVPLQQDLYRELRRHHVSLFTSTYGEGLGLVLLEAQANGCVPVATRIEGVTDFAIAEGETGLLAQNGEAQSFAAQIELLTDPQRWSSMSRAAFQRSRRTFTMEAMSRDFDSLLTALQRGEFPLSAPRSQLERPNPGFRRRDLLPAIFLQFNDALRRRLPERNARKYAPKNELSIPQNCRASVIIPTKNRAALLRTAVDGVLHHTDFPNLQVVIVDNGSSEPDALLLLDDLRRLPNVVVVAHEGAFNFSTLCNAGARAAAGDVLCFLNNDVRITQKTWLRELTGLALQPDVGAAGPLLFYPDGRVQHLGIRIFGSHYPQIMGDGTPAAEFRSSPAARERREVDALIGACLVVTRTNFDRIAGFDEKLAVAYNDADLCLHLRSIGLRSVWTPFAEMVHELSASRGFARTDADRLRFTQEVQHLQTKWRLVR